MLDILTDLFKNKESSASPQTDANLVSDLIDGLSSGKSIEEVTGKGEDKKKKKLTPEEEEQLRKEAAEKQQAIDDATRKRKGIESDSLSNLQSATSNTQSNAERANAEAQAVAQQNAQGVLQQLMNKKR